MLNLQYIRHVIHLTIETIILSSPDRNVGGQAVIEGVMMKGPDRWTVAVRGKDRNIHIKKEQLRRLPRILKLPVIRGVVTLYQAISLGIRAIDYSASKAYEGEEGKPMSPVAMILTVCIALLAGLGIFLFLPLYLTRLVGSSFPAVTESSMLFNLTDGLFRVAFFVLYVLGIGLWGEMRRIYEYHGAEHKVIHAYEKGTELDAGSILERYSTLHPRCGTSFLLIVMLVSIFVFSLIPHDWGFLTKFLSRVVLIPMIAGLSYEVLRLSARNLNSRVVNMLVYPGLLLQRLTTREPDEPQVEVALTALNEAVRE
jgi:uncharacterized protein YqhQ